MAKQNGKKDSFAGGIGLLAATAFVCILGIMMFEQRLKKTRGESRRSRQGAASAARPLGAAPCTPATLETVDITFLHMEVLYGFSG